MTTYYYDDTALRLAVQNGKKGEVLQLLKGGADVNQYGYESVTPLHEAALKGFTEIAGILIEHGAEVNATIRSSIDQGQTPLHFAVIHRQKDTAEFLITQGADVNKGDSGSAAPLYHASWRGSVDMAGLLIAHGASPNKADYLGRTPLCGAAESGHLEMVKLLLAQGAKILTVDNDGRTALHRASTRDIAALLVAEGANPAARDRSGMLPTDLAALRGHLEVVSLLQNLHMGFSNIFAAAAAGDCEELKRFLDRDPGDASAIHSTPWGFGYMPLHYAARYGQVKAVEYLIQRGAKVNGRCSYGGTPLSMAAEKGYTEVVRLLIANGADVHIKSHDNTPLHNAVNFGHREAAEILIDSGADINARDRYGNTPLYWAVHRGYRDVVELLITKGASAFTLNRFGESALRIAREKGHSDITKLLIASMNSVKGVKGAILGLIKWGQTRILTIF
ncbi:MAG: ankyrin repeat domain-containing protein [Vulcanimicrobiota bacterium]